MNTEQKDFYQKLRMQVHSWLTKNVDSKNQWTDYVLLAPDIFHLLCKLTVDPEIPGSKKAKLGAAIAYFISPLDFIPELILGPIGYLDDVALAAYVLNDIINEVDPQVVARHWAGEKDILLLVKTILINSDQMLGSGLWKRVRKRIGI
ncbi:MAG: YkvA family protein [Calditrichia bacterium]